MIRGYGTANGKLVQLAKQMAIPLPSDLAPDQKALMENLSGIGQSAVRRSQDTQPDCQSSESGPAFPLDHHVGRKCRYAAVCIRKVACGISSPAGRSGFGPAAYGHRYCAWFALGDASKYVFHAILPPLAR